MSHIQKCLKNSQLVIHKNNEKHTTGLNQHLSTGEEKKKQEYGQKQYKNLLEDEKNASIGKKNYAIWKNKTASQAKAG